MLVYLSIFNILFIVLSLIWLASLDKRYSLLKKPISALAKSKRSKTRFIVVISVFTTLQLFYALYIIETLNIEHKQAISSLMLAGSILLIASSIVVTKHIILHRKLVQASVALITLGMCLLTFQIHTINNTISIVIIVSTVLLLIVQYVLRSILKAGYWESPLLLLVIIWNVSTFLLVK